MQTKNIRTVAKKWTLAGSMLLVVLCSSLAVGQQTNVLECARKDSINVHPLIEASDVQSFISLIEEGKEFGIYPSTEALEKAMALADSLDLQKERVSLALSLLTEYYYVDAELTKQVAIAMILANGATLSHKSDGES